MGLRDLAESLAKVDALDPLADRLGGVVGGVFANRRLKDLLSGAWLGHSLHPILTDVPIGALTAATALDVVAGRDQADGVDALTVLGLVSIAPTAAAGLCDWADTVAEDRRLGMFHAMANVGAGALFTAALVFGRSGSRGAARATRLLGLAVLSAGGYLGGHLVFARGLTVDHNVFDQPPGEWTRVAREDDLVDDTPMLVSAGGYGVLLYRRNRSLYAITDRCSHAGGPLHEGEVDADLCVTCPWHGSRFRLADGSVVHGPATAPQVAFDAQVSDGNIEVRPRQVQSFGA